MKILTKLRSDFRGVRAIWGKYWAAYGGAAALFSSTYFYVALILTVINFGAWYHSGWWDVVVGSIPTILGFTLAGLAMLLGMDSGFSKFISGETDGRVSPFMILVSAFVHFILTQCIALLIALTVKSASFQLHGMPDWYYDSIYVLNRVVWFFGYFVYMYSLVQIFSAAFAIFRATRWYDLYISKK